MATLKAGLKGAKGLVGKATEATGRGTAEVLGRLGEQGSKGWGQALQAGGAKRIGAGVIGGGALGAAGIGAAAS